MSVYVLETPEPSWKSDDYECDYVIGEGVERKDLSVLLLKPRKLTNEEQFLVKIKWKKGRERRKLEVKDKEQNFTEWAVMQC